MEPDSERITHLELRYMEQQDLLDALNDELTKAVDQLARLGKRVDRLEQALQDVVRTIDPPANEKPPHY